MNEIYDVDALRRDFPILGRKVNGKPLTADITPFAGGHVGYGGGPRACPRFY